MNFDQLDIQDGQDPAEKQVQPSLRWDLDFDGTSVGTKDIESNEFSLANYVYDGAGPVTRELRERGLHYPLRFEPLALASGRYSPNVGENYAIVDSKTGFVLGRPVRKNYKIAQPTAIAGLLDAAVSAFDNLVSNNNPISILSWKGGERLSFRIPISISIDQLSEEQKKTIIEKRTHFNENIHHWEGRDYLVPPTESILVVTNSHGAQGGLSASLEMRFLVCDNGLMQNLDGSVFYFRHSGMLDRRIESMRQLFLAAGQQDVYMRDVLSCMMSKGMTEKQLDSLAETVFPEGRNQKENDVREENMDLFRDVYSHATGASPGCVYGAVAAATYWTTHVIGINVTRTLKQFSLNDDARPELEWAARYKLQMSGKSKQFNDAAMQWAMQQIMS